MSCVEANEHNLTRYFIMSTQLVSHARIHYRPQRSCEGYVFIPVRHSVHRGGLPQCMLGYPPPGSRHPRSRHTSSGADTPREETPPRSRHPWEETSPGSRHPSRTRHPPPGTRHPQEQAPLGPGNPRDQAPPGADPPGRRLPLRTVRILLECILVEVIFSRRGSNRRERGKTKIYAQKSLGKL